LPAAGKLRSAAAPTRLLRVVADARRRPPSLAPATPRVAAPGLARLRPRAET